MMINCGNCFNDVKSCECMFKPYQHFNTEIVPFIMREQEELYLFNYIFYGTWVKVTEGFPINFLYKKFPINENNIKNYQNNNLKMPNNQRYLFHGTPSNFCMTLKCGDCTICNISKNGFKLEHAGKRTNFLRFGNGLYQAQHSSKANDYTYPNNLGFRCIIVSLVNLGSPIRLTENKQQFIPPAGYHSVYGQADNSCNCLNYDEYVVYNEKQILPIGIIIYNLVKIDQQQIKQ